MDDETYTQEHHEIADQIYEAYLLQIKKQSPYMRLSFEKNKLDYLKAAAICIDEDFNPSLFVLALTKDQDMRKFYPQFLHSKHAVVKCAEFISKSCTLIPALFDTQIMYLQQMVTHTQRSLEQLLLDDSLDFSPWFRIVISKKPFPSVIEKYRKQAAKETTLALLEFLLEKELDVKRLRNL